MAGLFTAVAFLLASLAFQPTVGLFKHGLATFMDDGLQVVVNCSDAPFAVAKRCYDSNALELCYKGIGLGRLACEEPTTECNPEDATCVEPKSDLLCPQAFGYYPSLKSCNEYYICVNGVSHHVPCPQGDFVYDPHLMSCAAASEQSPCNRFVCSPQKHNKTIPYPGDPRLYALCNLSQAVALLECDRPWETFDEVDQGCNIRCLEEGNMALDYDYCSREYAECVSLGGGRFGTTARSCPQGSVFDPSYRHCVPGSCDSPLPVIPPWLFKIVGRMDPDALDGFMDRMPFHSDRLKEIVDRIRQQGPPHHDDDPLHETFSYSDIKHPYKK